MAKDLIPFDELGLALPDQKQGALEKLTRTSDFLPQLRVYGSESDIVKEQKFPMGHLGLYISADNVLDLDEQIDCLAFTYRPRASIITGDTPISFYSIESKEFTDIKDRAMKDKERGCLVGLEYLIYIPSIELFGLFLMGNPTLRRESVNLKALVDNAAGENSIASATIKVKLIKTSKFMWHGVTIFNCSTPLDWPEGSDLKEKIANFKNPRESEVELAEESSTDRER